MRRVWAWLGWAVHRIQANHPFYIALYFAAAVGVAADPKAKGWNWTALSLEAMATWFAFEGVKRLKAYLWEDVRFELIRPGGESDGGGGKKPETAAPRLPKTKDEVRCN
jgi:hypothetical protein